MGLNESMDDIFAKFFHYQVFKNYNTIIIVWSMFLLFLISIFLFFIVLNMITSLFPFYFKINMNCVYILTR